jgi:hypothetical protein
MNALLTAASHNLFAVIVAIIVVCGCIRESAKHISKGLAKRAQAKALAQANQGFQPLAALYASGVIQAPDHKTPGPCKHRNVQRIMARKSDGSGDEEIVGWLCLKTGCDAQLPADWATAAEDL